MRKIARSDEEFVKDAIIRHIGVSNAIRGEDPPDYYIGENPNKIALEITTLPPLGDRFTSDMSLDRLCKKLDDEFRNCIDVGTSILLKINSPVGRLRKFDRELRVLISNSINNDLLNNKWTPFLICGESIKLMILDHGIDSRKHIVGLIMGKGLPLTPIDIQLTEKLSSLLKAKSQKLKKLPCEKWLGILNDTILADENDFILSIENVHLCHDFSKIFLVGIKGKVNLIFNNQNHRGCC